MFAPRSLKTEQLLRLLFKTNYKPEIQHYTTLRNITQHYATLQQTAFNDIKMNSITSGLRWTTDRCSHVPDVLKAPISVYD